MISIRARWYRSYLNNTYTTSQAYFQQIKIDSAMHLQYLFQVFSWQCLNTCPTVHKINRASAIIQLTINLRKVKHHKFPHEETLAQVIFRKVGAFESDIDHSNPTFLML